MIGKQTRLPRGIFYLLSLAILGFLSMLPEWALAADIFPTVAGDKSIELLLKPVFGELFGGAPGPFAQAILYLNGAALVIGGIIVAYTLIIGTMQTAHDGEMLGKKWSSMWVPIRTVLGIGMVVPMASGFCVAQMLVAWLTLQGVYLADQAWGAFSSATFSDEGLKPKGSIPAVADLAQGMLKNLVCVQTGNKLKAEGADQYNEFSMADLNGGQGRKYGMTGTASSIDTRCGSLTFYWIDAPDISGTVVAAGTSMSTEDRKKAQEAIEKAHKDATLAMEMELNKVAYDLVWKDGQFDVANIETAITNYQTKVSEVSSTVFGDAKAFKALQDASSSDGWFMAGAWFMKIAQMQDVVNKAVAEVPSTLPPSSYAQGPDWSRSYAILDGALAKTSGQFGIESVQENKDDPDSKTGTIAKALKKATKAVSEFIVHDLFGGGAFDPSRHPVMAAKDYGDKLMVASEIAILGSAVGIGIAGVFSSAVGMFLGSIILTLFVPLFGFGATLSVYTPILPFIVFFGTALGWLLLVAEAIIAAPLWAIMHLVPDGDGFMGHARQGYMLLLGLLLRPALIILGFILSVIAVEHILRFFNMVFFPVLSSSMGDSLVGLGTMVIASGIYMGTVIYLMHKLFALTHVIPDKLLRWIGGGGEQLGEIGQGVAQEGHRYSGAVIATSKGASESIAKGGGQTAMQAKQVASSERGAVAQEKSNQENRNSSAGAARRDANKAFGEAEVLDMRAQETNDPKDIKAAQNAWTNAADMESEALRAETKAASGGTRSDPEGGLASDRLNSIRSRSDAYNTPATPPPPPSAGAGGANPPNQTPNQPDGGV